MNRIITALLIAAALGAAPVGAAAQAPTAPVRVRGTVQKLEHSILTVKASDGKLVGIKLADNYTVNGVAKATLDEVTAGKFIGTTTLGERNGELIALEVHIFPESMRGTGEGHYDWDLKPGSKMTNANVADVVGIGKDRVLTVRYKGGQQKVRVPDTASIVTFAPAERGTLKRGAHIFCIAQRQPDGTLTAARVNVGLKGAVPPM